MHVLVTGGSRGIGKATVEYFAKQGHKVSFLYEKEFSAAKEVERTTGAVGYACDVASSSAVAETIAKMPPVDVLVNNAGICHTGLISQITEEEFDRIFAVNVKGMYNCVRAVLPAMLQKGKGSIVNVSSMWGQVGASCEVSYSATKGAVIAMTKALAKELGPSHIRVNCVAPGVIQTDMCNNIEKDILSALQEETPIGRLGTAEDVAKAIGYLAEAEFVTGQVLGVNGGFVI
ncbi:MAG: SDR family oxidoreductase [Oscillospiraceae bacterium]|nr:SDR family oxidoreductase [Oscillospiraceae bacterium]